MVVEAEAPPEQVEPVETTTVRSMPKDGTVLYVTTDAVTHRMNEYSVELDAGVAPKYSPAHPIAVKWHGDVLFFDPGTVQVTKHTQGPSRSNTRELAHPITIA